MLRQDLKLGKGHAPLSTAVTLFLLALLVCTGSFAQTAATVESEEASRSGSELEERLEALTLELEENRQKMHIPGMAIAVVKDDAIILARGFGFSDLEQETPVTADTIFAIGSSTKAFTSTLVGMLVDEGKMSWDDPVTKYLPYFKLAIDTEDELAEVTIRDLLAHRTGFTRMGILWAGNSVSREEVLKTAVTAEPWSNYRGDFYYNNVTYMAAGVAAEKAAQSTWEAMIEDRILKPLEMKTTTTSVAQAQKDERLSLGYLWQDESQKHTLQSMRKLAAVAPAGAINSNVLDMTKWLRLQLQHGRFGDKTLLSKNQLEETWTPQIKINSATDYGLGWMLRTVDGHRVVEHGGNIDGFSAQVTLVPDANLGFVLLTNLSATPLQSTSTSLVVRALLGDLPTAEATSGASSEDLAQFVGKYEANFGPFKEAFFTVSAEDGHLAVDVPGQTNYELKAPNEDGKRYFALTDAVAVSFDHAKDGSVVGLKMHQGGMTFELPREGVLQVAEIPIDQLQPFLGTYHLDEADQDFKVLIAHQHLAVDVPGQMVFELKPPDEAGRRGFRATDKVSVSFQQAEDGAVETMTVYEGEKTRVLEKVKDAASADTANVELPTVEEILALRGNQAIQPPKSVRLQGKVRMVHSGVSGAFDMAALGLHKYRLNMDFGKFGWSRVVVNDTTGRTESSFAPDVALEGKFLRQAHIESPVAWLGDFRKLFDSVRVLRAEKLEETDVYVLGLYSKDLPRLTIFVDAETADVVKAEMTVINPTLGINMETVTRHEDFREVNGHRIAFRTSSRNQFTGTFLVELNNAEFNIELDEKLFGDSVDEMP